MTPSETTAEKGTNTEVSTTEALPAKEKTKEQKKDTSKKVADTLQLDKKQLKEFNNEMQTKFGDRPTEQSVIDYFNAPENTQGKFKGMTYNEIVQQIKEDKNTPMAEWLQKKVKTTEPTENKESKKPEPTKQDKLEEKSKKDNKGNFELITKTTDEKGKTEYKHYETEKNTAKPKVEKFTEEKKTKKKESSDKNGFGKKLVKGTGKIIARPFKTSRKIIKWPFRKSRDIVSGVGGHARGTVRVNVNHQASGLKRFGKRLIKPLKRK